MWRSIGCIERRFRFGLGILKRPSACSTSMETTCSSDASSDKLRWVSPRFGLCHSRACSLNTLTHGHCPCSQAFLKAAKPKKAMAAYEKQRAWQELFTLAVREGVVNLDELEAMGRRVGGEVFLLAAEPHCMMDSADICNDTRQRT